MVSVVSDSLSEVLCGMRECREADVENGQEAAEGALGLWSGRPAERTKKSEDAGVGY